MCSRWKFFGDDSILGKQEFPAMLFCACTGKLHPLELRLVIRLAEAVKQYSAMSVYEVDITMDIQIICEKLLL